MRRLLIWLTDHNLFPPCSRAVWDQEYDDVLICFRPRWHGGEHEDSERQVRWYDSDIVPCDDCQA